MQQLGEGVEINYLVLAKLQPHNNNRLLGVLDKNLMKTDVLLIFIVLFFVLICSSVLIYIRLLLRQHVAGVTSLLQE